MPGDPHGPNKLIDYVQIHESAMRRFLVEGFVLVDGTRLASVGGGVFDLSGDIECAGELVLQVEKALMHVDGEGSTLRVRTHAYRYNALLKGHGVVFRYESPHGDSHRPDHHVHRYRVLEGDTEGVVEDCQWPSLSRVIEEFSEWYYENFEAIQRLRTR